MSTAFELKGWKACERFIEQSGISGSVFARQRSVKLRGQVEPPVLGGLQEEANFFASRVLADTTLFVRGHPDKVERQQSEKHTLRITVSAKLFMLPTYRNWKWQLC